MDRTKEFAEFIKTSTKNSNLAISHVPVVKSQSAFNEAASEIARGST